MVGVGTVHREVAPMCAHLQLGGDLRRREREQEQHSSRHGSLGTNGTGTCFLRVSERCCEYMRTR